MLDFIYSNIAAPVEGGLSISWGALSVMIVWYAWAKLRHLLRRKAA